MSSTIRRSTSRRFHASFRPLGLMAVVCAAAGLGGCMKMETQRTTLEHRPNVVRPDGGGESAVATVPESGTQGGNDSFR